MNESPYILDRDQAIPFNEGFIESLQSPEGIQKAAASATVLTRWKLREESFVDKILPPQDISNSDLDRVQDPEVLVKFVDREPDSGPAKVIPFGVLPDRTTFKGSRYPVYFYGVSSEIFSKDINKLRGYTYDIRGVIYDQSTKEIAKTIDKRFIEGVDAAIAEMEATKDNYNELKNLTWDYQPGVPFTRDSLVDAVAVFLQHEVPFGPLQTDTNASSPGTVLCNIKTATEILKWDRSEAGGDVSQEMLLSGKPIRTPLGLNLVTTMKDDVVPPGTVYFFAPPEYLGVYYRLQPLTVYIEQKFIWLQTFQMTIIGMSIGNTRGIMKATFTTS